MSFAKIVQLYYLFSENRKNELYNFIFMPFLISKIISELSANQIVQLYYSSTIPVEK